MIRLCIFVAAVFMLALPAKADGYYYSHRYRYSYAPFYDTVYIGNNERLGYRGRRYTMGAPAWALGDPAYGGCRLGPRTRTDQLGNTSRARPPLSGRIRALSLLIQDILIRARV